MSGTPIEHLWFEVQNINLYRSASGNVELDTSLICHDGSLIEIGGDVSNKTENVVRIDGKDRWVLPALVDCHTHPAITANPEENRIFESGVMRRFGPLGSNQTHANLREAFTSGVMAVREMGTPQHMLSEQDPYRDGEIPPLVKSCVQPITGPDGHLSNIGREISDSADIEAVITDLLELGASHVKVANDPITIEQDVLSEIVETSHEHGLAVSCHVHTPSAIEMAIKTGCDTIEHAFPPTKTLAKKAIANDTVFVPTYYCSDASLLPEAATTIEKEEIDTFLEWRTNLDEYADIALASNVPIAVGTDAGLPPIGFDAVWKEVVALSELGFEVEELLYAATIAGASILGYQSAWTIEEGTTAFLILVEDDPRKQLHTLRTAKPLLFDGVPTLGVSDEKLTGEYRVE